MGNKIEDLLNAMRLGELMHRRDPMEKKRHVIMCILAILGAITAVAAIAYAVYRYMNPDYLEDFDDDFDDFEDDMDIDETTPKNATVQTPDVSSDAETE